MANATSPNENDPKTTNPDPTERVGPAEASTEGEDAPDGEESEVRTMSTTVPPAMPTEVDLRHWADVLGIEYPKDVADKGARWKFFLDAAAKAPPKHLEALLLTKTGVRARRLMERAGFTGFNGRGGEPALAPTAASKAAPPAKAAKAPAKSQNLPVLAHAGQPAIKPISDEEFESLKVGIIQEYRLGEKTLAILITNIGRKLNKIKCSGRIQHGDWMAWLRETFSGMPYKKLNIAERLWDTLPTHDKPTIERACDIGYTNLTFILRMADARTILVEGKVKDPRSGRHVDLHNPELTSREVEQIKDAVNAADTRAGKSKRGGGGGRPIRFFSTFLSATHQLAKQADKLLVAADHQEFREPASKEQLRRMRERIPVLEELLKIAKARAGAKN